MIGGWGCWPLSAERTKGRLGPVRETELFICTAAFTGKRRDVIRIRGIKHDPQGPGPLRSPPSRTSVIKNRPPAGPLPRKHPTANAVYPWRRGHRRCSAILSANAKPIKTKSANKSRASRKTPSAPSAPAVSEKPHRLQGHMTSCC